MSKMLTHSQIKKLLAKCQKRLRLSDWDIDLTIVEFDDFPLGRIAECKFSEADMEAHMRVLDPRHNHFKSVSAQNIEASIYHELLHIIITPYLGENVPDRLEEQIIERIAKAMVGI